MKDLALRQATVTQVHGGERRFVLLLRPRTLSGQKDFPVLKAALLRELQGNHAGVFEDFEPEQRKQAWDRTLPEADDYLSTQGWKDGFFIERGMVHVNIGRFLFDCATGNFNPVEVPDRFLTPEFLAVLKKAR